MNPPSTSHIPGVDPVSTVSQRPADTPSPQAGIRAPVTLRSSELSVTCRPRRLVSADWSRPIAVGAGSVLARMSRYGPAVPGTLAPQTRSAPVRTGTSRHCPIRFIKINRIQERTLNPRVRGSSPWQRTRYDLGFYSRLFFIRPFCPRGCSRARTQQSGTCQKRPTWRPMRGHSAGTAPSRTPTPPGLTRPMV
jgi:hypothetical protein